MYDIILHTNYDVNEIRKSIRETDLTITEAKPIPEDFIYLTETFLDCENLKVAPKIPDNIVGMIATFEGCVSLKEAPIIPDKVTDMNSTFFECTNLIKAPDIPDSVTCLDSTFAECVHLEEPPKIGKSVETMFNTFGLCQSLKKAPDIPAKVTDMDSAFAHCYNLRGDIYIYSDNVESCFRCFACHNPKYELNVYAHKDTLTWKTFEWYLNNLRKLYRNLIGEGGEHNIKLKELH